MTIKEIEDYIENKYDTNIAKKGFHGLQHEISNPNVLGIFLSEEFIGKYIKSLDVKLISMHQKLSIEFILTHENILDKEFLIENKYIPKAFKFPYCNTYIPTIEFYTHMSLVGFYRKYKYNGYTMPRFLKHGSSITLQDFLKLIYGTEKR